MPALVVRAQSLRRSGGAKELGRERRRLVDLPSDGGDAVAAGLAALAVPDRSQVELVVPRLRLLAPRDTLSDVAEQWALHDWPGPPASRGRKAPRRKAGEELPTLLLTAVPRGERCAARGC